MGVVMKMELYIVCVDGNPQVYNASIGFAPCNTNPTFFCSSDAAIDAIIQTIRHGYEHGLSESGWACLTPEAKIGIYRIDYARIELFEWYRYSHLADSWAYHGKVTESENENGTV